VLYHSAKLMCLRYVPIGVLDHISPCGTGTAGTATFCLSGTKTGMQFGSGTGFRSEYKKAKKKQK